MNNQQNREIVIATLERCICNAISKAVESPEGVTIPEVLIALSDASLRWSRMLHKEDASLRTPAQLPLDRQRETENGKDEL